MKCPQCKWQTIARGYNTFHCDNCGTLVYGAHTVRPRLIERCKSFAKAYANCDSFQQEWAISGIESTISPPPEIKEHM